MKERVGMYCAFREHSSTERPLPRSLPQARYQYRRSNYTRDAFPSTCHISRTSRQGLYHPSTLLRSRMAIRSYTSWRTERRISGRWWMTGLTIRSPCTACYGGLLTSWHRSRLSSWHRTRLSNWTLSKACSRRTTTLHRCHHPILRARLTGLTLRTSWASEGRSTKVRRRWHTPRGTCWLLRHVRRCRYTPRRRCTVLLLRRNLTYI
jgi:hypothetical protein